MLRRSAGAIYDYNRSRIPQGAEIRACGASATRLAMAIIMGGLRCVRPETNIYSDPHGLGTLTTCGWRGLMCSYGGVGGSLAMSWAGPIDRASFVLICNNLQ